MNSKGKILVASPRFLLRAGVESVFSKMGFTIIVDSKSQDDLERNIVNHSPDLVFIDSKEGCFKIEKTIAFLSITKPAKTILIADDISKKPCELYLKVGVQGIITSSISEQELGYLFKAIQKNEVYVVDKIKNLLLIDEA